MYVYIYIYIYMGGCGAVSAAGLQGRGWRARDILFADTLFVRAAPRNPAPRNHLLVWIVKSSGCHCTDGHLTSRVFTEDRNIS